MKALLNIATLIEKLNTITGVSFVSVNYTNKDNEVQQSLINVGVNRTTALKEDLATIKVSTYSSNDKYDEVTFNQAKAELLKSAKLKLGIKDDTMTEKDIQQFENRSKGQTNSMTKVGEHFFYNENTQDLYVYGMKIKKTVLVEGDYKADTRRPKTIAKDEVRKNLKADKIRRYSLEGMNICNLKGETLEFN